VRGKVENSLVLLGSATPSLESLHNVNERKLGRLLLPERVGKRPLPSIDVVDMRRESKKDWLSRSLKNLISETLERGEQVLLFLNRRGFAPHVFCGDCGHTFKCPHCSVSLTWHQRQKRLRCHYCDYQIAALPMCPECQGDNVMGFGLGTEKLEAELGEFFEGASIARIDRDTVKTKGSMERLLGSFGRGEIDILVGTQMIAKGHHFPGVTLVGVLMADLSLNVPDFRAAERTFQLLTQVAGRAGRGDQPGRVVVQTFLPDHYAVLHGGEDDAALFYKEEFEMRKAFSYPPFCRLLNIKLESSDEEVVATCAKRLRLAGERFLKEQGLSCIELLGPVPSPMSRIKRKYRWHMVAKCADASPLHRFARAVISYMKEEKLSSRVRLVTDFDPYSLL
jgi:primosomal protein N' (replication factor Y)